MPVWKRLLYAHQIKHLWIRLSMLVSVVRGLSSNYCSHSHQIPPLCSTQNDVGHMTHTSYISCHMWHLPWRPDESMQNVTAIHNKHAILLNNNVCIRFTTTDFPRILTVFVPPPMVLTLSLRFSFNSENILSLIRAAADLPTSYARSQFAGESATIPVEITTTDL